MADTLGLSSPVPRATSAMPSQAVACGRDREADVAGHDDDGAVERRAPGAEEPVRGEAADDREQVDGRAVDRDDGRAGRLVDAEAAVGGGVDEEVQQDGAHAVVGEALPQLDEEERRQPLRVPEEGAVIGARADPRCRRSALGLC